MGFLDSTSVTVDAILTKRGRELLAKGEGEFKITRFSLSDDEIDLKLGAVQEEKIAETPTAASPLLEALRTPVA